MLTKNRVANGLAVVAAVAGMVLVITGAGGQKGDDDAPATPSTSQVAPAVPGAGQAGPSAQPGGPAQSQPPAPGQSRPSAPAPKKDDDGDDDGN